MDKGEDYISVMRENRSVEENDRPTRKDIQPEHAEDEKQSTKATSEDSAVKIAHFLITLANGNPYILT